MSQSSLGTLYHRCIVRPLLAGLPKLRNRHFLFADVAALCLVPTMGLLLRLDATVTVRPYAYSLITYTLCALGVRLVVFYYLGLYDRYWRYATIEELSQIIRAVLISTVGVGLAYLAFLKAPAFGLPLPRSVPLIDGLLCLAVVGGTRFSARVMEHSLRRSPDPAGRPVLIVGADAAGQSIVRELQANPELGLYPVGYLDEDVYKHRVRIQNAPVFGGHEMLLRVVRRYRVSEVIIALPKASGKVIRELVSLCDEAGVAAKIVPAMHEILGGSVSVNHLRTVDIEDLLRREPVQTDIAAVREFIRGKRVLITGGGGSIGSELCRQVLHCEPAELALLGHGENSIFETLAELEQLQPQASFGAPDGLNGMDGGGSAILHGVIADIRFPGRIRSVLADFRPHIIFHAAAHKHVPLMEANVAEAISNNVLGTKNLVDAALELGVERFVMISTDKAINPTSIMGASKRAAELVVLRAGRESGKPYVAVRFGNVLGSRGSVVLTFKRQIAAGGPVTISHPEMTRYFMTIPEAVQLVLQASVLGRSGEVFVLDMGEPVKIVDLARDLIELSGLEVGRDIDITYTGIRPGEKLYEELFVAGESYEPTHHKKILIARNASAFVPRALDELIASMERAVARDDCLAVLGGLKALIPEFNHISALYGEVLPESLPSAEDRLSLPALAPQPGAE
jgi:FlaA1/EpsC-like NDP-sugar epimerase